MDRHPKFTIYAVFIFKGYVGLWLFLQHKHINLDKCKIMQFLFERLHT